MILLNPRRYPDVRSAEVMRKTVEFFEAKIRPALVENCYSCHSAHAAVDTTFVQFYPTLAPIAKAKGTFKVTP